PGRRLGRLDPRGTVLRCDGLFTESLWAGDHGKGLSEASGECGPARWHVRSDDRAPSGVIAGAHSDDHMRACKNAPRGARVRDQRADSWWVAEYSDRI